MKTKEFFISFGKQQHKKWSTAFPTIFTSLFLFFSLYYCFGISYVLLTPFLTQFFRMEHTKNWNYSTLFFKFFILYFLCICAFLASQTFIFCILINFFIPLLFVLFFTNQFTPKAYMVYGMEWIFLQIHPIPSSQFPTQLLALTYGILSVFLFLILYRYTILKPMKKPFFTQGLSVLHNIYINIDNNIPNRFIPLQNLLHEFQHYLFITNEPLFLFSKCEKFNQKHQLFMFFEKIQYIHEKIPLKQWIQNENDQQYFKKLGEFLITIPTTSSSYQTEIIKLHDFINRYQLSTPSLNQMYHETLIFLMEILKNNKRENLLLQYIQWVQTMFQTFTWKDFIQLEQFQLRFALRLSIALSCTFSFCFATHMEHSYWIPLTIFFTLMPYSDESNTKIIHRILGTIIGILITTILHLFFPTMEFLFVFIIIFTCFMYSIPPTSWKMTIYTTCYGMTLASLSLGLEKAIILRLIYVAIGITISFLASHFLFPNTIEKEFKKNINRLYKLNKSLLQIVSNAQNERQTISLFQKQKLYANLLAKEIYQYQMTHPTKSTEYVSNLLEKQRFFTSELGYLFFYSLQKRKNKENDFSALFLTLSSILFETNSSEEREKQLEEFLYLLKENPTFSNSKFSYFLFTNFIYSLLELIKFYNISGINLSYHSSSLTE